MTKIQSLNNKQLSPFYVIMYVGEQMFLAGMVKNIVHRMAGMA